MLSNLSKWNGSRFILNRKMGNGTVYCKRSCPARIAKLGGLATATNGHNHPVNLTE